MLRVIENTSNITFDKINEILSAKESILKYVVENGRFLNPEKLIETIFLQPFTKVNHLTNPGIYAEKTARNYLNTLCEMQVLEKKVIEGKHYYLNLELYRILSE